MEQKGYLDCGEAALLTMKFSRARHVLFPRFSVPLLFLFPETSKAQPGPSTTEGSRKYQVGIN